MNVILLVLLSLPLISGAPAYAATFTELSDAGDSLASAQVISESAVGTPLEAISGTLSADTDGVDLFGIYLTGGATFSATTAEGTELDTQLFLFDANGFGVYANDDAPLAQQSTLPADSPLTPQVPGLYYLAVGEFNFNPFSTLGSIFDTVSDPRGVVGPQLPGGSAPLAFWQGFPEQTGEYTVFLTGAQSVPESSSTLGLLAVALAGAVLRTGHLKRTRPARRP